MKPLDGRHRSAAALLGQGASQAEAAEAAGVGRRTVQDWLKRDDFQALVRDLREREASSEPGALARLRELLRSDDESIALRAAIELVRAGRGGTDPAEDRAAQDVQVFEDAFDDETAPEPEPIDLADFYETWDGEVSQREADAHDRGGAAFGDGWEAR